jgi:hypothetical protein
MLRILVAVVTLAGIFTAATAKAASYSYQFDQSSYTLLPGHPLDVRVYLVETGATELTGSGLVGADFLVNWAGASAAVTSVAANPSFTFDPTVTIGSTSAELLLGTMTPVKANPLLLGTFTFTAGPTATGLTTITTADPWPGSGGDVATADHFNVDDPDITNAVATIRVVTPEPGAILLLLMAGLSLLGYAWHKRR